MAKTKTPREWLVPFTRVTNIFNSVGFDISKHSAMDDVKTRNGNMLPGLPAKEGSEEYGAAFIKGWNDTFTSSRKSWTKNDDARLQFVDVRGIADSIRQAVDAARNEIKNNDDRDNVLRQTAMLGQIMGESFGSVFAFALDRKLNVPKSFMNLLDLTMAVGKKQLKGRPVVAARNTANMRPNDPNFVPMDLDQSVSMKMMIMVPDYLLLQSNFNVSVTGADADAMLDSLTKKVQDAGPSEDQLRSFAFTYGLIAAARTYANFGDSTSLKREWQWIMNTLERASSTNTVQVVNPETGNTETKNIGDGARGLMNKMRRLMRGDSSNKKSKGSSTKAKPQVDNKPTFKVRKLW